MSSDLLFNSLLLQALLFVGWSGALYLIALGFSRLNPNIIKWSRFWQLWLVLSLIPLLPFVESQENHFIPDPLYLALSESTQNIIEETTSSYAIQRFISDPDIDVMGDFSSIFILVILGIASVYLINFIRTLVQLKSLQREAKPLSDFSLFSPQQQRWLCDKRMSVCVSDKISSPFVSGFFNPVLCFPEFVFELPQQQRQLIINHEFVHVKRLDPQSVILFRICANIFWFNPFIRYFERQFIQNMELNCDAEVVSHSSTAKTEYAKALISNLKLGLNYRNRQSNTLTAQFSAQLSAKSEMEERIKAVMSPQQKRLNMVIARLVLLSLAVLLVSLVINIKTSISQDLKELTYAAQGHIEKSDYLPVTGASITTQFGEKKGATEFSAHTGIDFTVTNITDVYSSFSGKVIVADDISLANNYGLVVLIEQADKKQSLYARLGTLSVTVGQHVKAGQIIGTIGRNGTDFNLHFEMFKNGKSVDPNLYVNF